MSSPCSAHILYHRPKMWGHVKATHKTTLFCGSSPKRGQTNLCHCLSNGQIWTYQESGDYTTTQRFPNFNTSTTDDGLRLCLQYPLRVRPPIMSPESFSTQSSTCQYIFDCLALLIQRMRNYDSSACDLLPTLDNIQHSFEMLLFLVWWPWRHIEPNNFQVIL